MIQARGLTKRYGDRTAVDDLSFTVGPGIVTGFLGPNGAGKSTTMRMIVGLDAPDAGDVTVNGRWLAGLIAAPAPRARGTRMTIRILLADDQPLFRQGFRMVLSAQPDIEVVGEAGDGAEAVRMTRMLVPDVVLMDVRMPGVDGIAATREIVAQTPQTRVLILTTYNIDRYAFSGLNAGASGFLLKDVLPADLAAAIRAVARGDAVIAPSVTRRLLEVFAHRLPEDDSTPPDDVLAALTDRERQVFAEIVAGLSNAEIATRLRLSDATVKTHVGRILSKLGLRDRVQAVILAYESGIAGTGGTAPGPRTSS